MDYPLIIRGEEQGRLSVEQHGLFTVFEGRCEAQEGLLRLSVYGGGREGYLGLMQPRSGGLYLKRKFSRSQMAGFPESIEYAAEAIGLTEEKSPTAKSSPSEIERPSPEGGCGKELIWFRRSDGSLVSHDGKSGIVALPAKLRQIPPQAVIRRIDGRSYMLFRY